MKNAIFFLGAAIASCGGDALPSGDDGGAVTHKEGGLDSASGGGDAAAAFHWYETCGDPVCRVDVDAGASTCGSFIAGLACATEGQECDPALGCDVKLRCAASDPRMSPGGCPISRARFKKDIHYLGPDELARYYEELLQLKLATYRYRPPALDRTRLGFVLDDAESSVAADPERDLVDLYGYTSMAVAALKVQALQIERLQKQVDALQRKQARQHR